MCCGSRENEAQQAGGKKQQVKPRERFNSCIVPLIFYLPSLYFFDFMWFFFFLYFIPKVQKSGVNQKKVHLQEYTATCEQQTKEAVKPANRSQRYI